jgi:hypothetical protein
VEQVSVNHLRPGRVEAKEERRSQALLGVPARRGGASERHPVQDASEQHAIRREDADVGQGEKREALPGGGLRGESVGVWVQ